MPPLGGPFFAYLRELFAQQKMAIDHGEKVKARGRASPHG